MKKGVNIHLSILLGILFQISGLHAQPADWTITFTSVNHTLVIPASSMLEVDGEPLAVGAWIGAFFELPDGSLQCGGRVEWRGASTVLPMYGTNGSNPPDGFASGEKLKLKLWLPRQQCVIDSLRISYLNEPVYTHEGFFAANGLSGLGVLEAESGVQLTLGQDTSLCAGESIQLDAGCCGAYRWSTGDTTARITVSEAGVYRVEVESAIGCMQSDSIRIDSLGAAQAAFQFQLNDERLSCQADAQDSASYQWDFGDGNTGSGRVTSHQYDQRGVYTIRLITTNACGSDTAEQQVQVDVISSIAELWASKLHFFPNPASQQLFLQSDLSTSIKASLVNAQGQTVKQIHFRNQFTWDIQDMQTGMYLIIFHTSTENFVTKHLLIKN